MSNTNELSHKDWYSLYRSEALTRERRGKHLRKLKRIGLLGEPKDLKILDLCCGQGEMLSVLAERGFRFLKGVDAMPDQELLRKPQGWSYQCQSVLEYTPERGSWDRILCAHSLHHLGGAENIGRVLEKAYEGLRPGGALILIDHYDSWQLRLSFWILQSFLAEVTPWSKMFRRQLIEEKHYLYDYLDHWKEIQKKILGLSFQEMRFHYDLFFFYFRGIKP